MTRRASDTAASALGQLASSCKSILKVLLQSRRTTISRAADTDLPLIILGNGPSLNTTIKENADALRRYRTMAVNFAANAPEFKTLRPRYYTLADPHFFHPDGDSNVERLVRNLNDVDHEMTLFIPAGQSIAVVNPHVKIEHFNPIGAEGWRWLTRWLYDRRLAMPRPRNVLIPSIMIGLWMGYKEIYLTGADHSWTRTLWVNENNEVVSVQPHFYADNDDEHARVTSVYRNVRLHDMLRSLYVAFSAYFEIASYADHRHAAIYNATPDSFIDAFPRQSLPPR